MFVEGVSKSCSYLHLGPSQVPCAVLAVSPGEQQSPPTCQAGTTDSHSAGEATQPRSRGSPLIDQKLPPTLLAKASVQSHRGPEHERKEPHSTLGASASGRGRPLLGRGRLCGLRLFPKSCPLAQRCSEIHGKASLFCLYSFQSYLLRHGHGSSHF